MGDLAIISDGAMLVRDSRIERVGTRAEIDLLVTEDHEVIDAGGRIVLPGFVDAHTHPVFAGSRADEFVARARGSSYQEIAAAGGGIMSTVRGTRAATEDELFEKAKRHAEWFLRCGTTTVEAKSGYGLTLEDELKILRVIQRLDHGTPLCCVPTFLGAHAVPPEMSKSEYVGLVVEEMLPAASCAHPSMMSHQPPSPALSPHSNHRAEGVLAEYCDIFVEEGYFDADDASRILGRAKALGLRARMHVDQMCDGGGAMLAAELGAQTADHLEHTSIEGIRALKKSAVQPVLLPASVHCMGLAKYPEARAMIDEGLAVVIATDFNPGTSPTPSMPFVISLAVTQMKMSPAEAITASTINAAYSLSRGHDRGSLEAGKRADFVMWDCADYREIGYWVGPALVHRVSTGGVAAQTG